MGEMKGGMKTAKVLYLKGFLAINGRDGGIFNENYYFLKNQVKVFPPWE